MPRHRSRSRERGRDRDRRGGQGGGQGYDQDYLYEYDRRPQQNLSYHDRHNPDYEYEQRGGGGNWNRGGGGGRWDGGQQQQPQQSWPIRDGGMWGGQGQGGRGGEYYEQNAPSNSNYNRGGGGYRDREQDRYPDSRRGERDDNRNRGGNRRLNHEEAEQQRIEVSTRHPRRNFLEEVDLPLEYAFRMDTRSEQVNLDAARSFAYNQTPSYMRNSFYQDNMLGASKDYIDKLPGSKFCKPKVGLDEFGNVVDAQTEKPIESLLAGGSQMISQTVPKAKLNPLSTSKPITFLSLNPTQKKSKPGTSSTSSNNNNRIDFGNSLSFGHKNPGKGIQERTEQFNAKLREEPKNVSLWKEFVQFQEQVFDETNQTFEDEGDGDGDKSAAAKKKRRARGRKKALIEKKVAILDKALVSNPKSIELCVDRLDLLTEIYKPNYVLTEWKKLASLNQDSSAFWFEYMGCPSTQLQLYSSTTVAQIYEKTFEKFRTMLSPSYPKFQRPAKSSIVLADMLYSICALLRNSGFNERSTAIQQAQLEMDFNLPLASENSKGSKEDWKKTLGSFIQFWERGKLRFGEPGAIGWRKEVTGEESCQNSESNFIPDAQVSEFEDEFFSSVSDFELGLAETKPDSVIWLYAESLRSKMYWVPWRALKGPSSSGSEEEYTCDDSQRLVPPADVTPFIINIAKEIHGSDFERQSVYFRHVVHFLLSLREDFLSRTHVLDTLLPPLANYSLSDSRTLFTQIYYCKKFLNFYHESSNPHSGEEESSGFLVPEGFRLNEFTVPAHSTEIPSSMSLISTYSNEVEDKKKELLRRSAANYTLFIRSIVEQSLEHLEGKFATTLVQILLRFEQRNTYNSTESQKARMKYVKTLMKHEKLRGSNGAYGEVAMLEYFGGSRQKAIDLLVKTINPIGKSLREMETKKDLESNFELVAEITQLYRVLAEFHLRGSPEVALEILVALGNKFSVVDVTAKSTTDPTVDTKRVTNTNAFLKAKKFFELVLSWLLPPSLTSEENGGVVNLEEEDPGTGSKCNFEGDTNRECCVELLLQDTNLIVEWTSAYALFRYLSGDLDSASELYGEVMEKTKPLESLSRTTRYQSDVIFRHHIREQLYVNWSKLCALVLSTCPMENSKFRNILCKAIQEYPSSPALLLLFTDVESQCSIVGKLWRAMVSIVKQDSSQCSFSQHWAPLFMSFGLAQQIERLEKDEIIGLDSFGLGGPAVPPDTIFYKLDALLTAAQANSLTRNVPLIWRVHLKHLVMRSRQGKDGLRAKGLFYEAIRHCPSSKSIYMDGIAYFPELKKEISDLMVEKGIFVRLPEEELDLLLEIDKELEDEVREKTKVEAKKPLIQMVTLDDDSDEGKKPIKLSKESNKRKPMTDEKKTDGTKKRKVMEEDEVQVLSDGEIEEC